MKRFNILICCVLLFVCTGCSDRQEFSISEIPVTEPSITEAVSGAEVCNNAANSTKASAEQAAVVVHVCGAVVSPGIYTLNAGARCAKAIEAAGGFSENAATFYLNLASVLEDGMQIYVPTKQEVEGGQMIGPVSQTGQSTSSKSDLLSVNLNTASIEQLMELPGIGESKAAAIIAYREEHGSFKAIDELKNISGIKDGTFEKLKPYITVK